MPMSISSDTARLVKLKFHGTIFRAWILARMSRGRCAETGPVELQLKVVPGEARVLVDVMVVTHAA